MLDVKLDALESGIEATRIALRDGILSINVWDKDTGLTLIDWQGNATAVALLTQLSMEISDSLEGSELPQLKDYYYIDLDQNQALVVMDHGQSLMEGWLLDSTKTNPGILLGMAIPRAINNAKAAKSSHTSQEDLLNLVMSSSKLGLWDMMVDAGNPVSPKNAFTWSNEFRQMIGFENEQDFPNVLESWSNLLPEDQRDITLKAFADHLNDYTGQTPYDIEYQLKNKNGEYRWYRASGETSRDANGIPLRVVGSIKDITEERKKSGNTKLVNHVG